MCVVGGGGAGPWFPWWGRPECVSLCMGLPLCWWLEPPGPGIKCECPWECDRAGCKGGLGNPGGLAELSGCETPLLPLLPPPG